MIPFEKIKQSPLVKQFIENRFDNKNVLVYAEGGFGKTTAMRCLQVYLLDLAQKEKIVPLYIDVKKIDQFSNKPLIHYIYTEYSGSDTKESDVENLFTDQAPSTQYKYKYYILIDGYNEVPVSARFNINSEISNFAQKENVRIILSSRLNEQVDIFEGFKRISLLGLNDAQIKLYLKKQFQMDFDLEKVNQSLLNILRSPLYMSAFSKTYGRKKPFPELFSEKEVRKGDILDNFIFHSLDKLRPNESINDLLAEFILLYFMPALAFKMYKNENFTITRKEMEQLVDDVNYFKSLLDVEKQGKYLGEYSRNIYDIEKICCDNIAVLQRTVNGYEMHNIYRDFFAAKQVINFINAGLINELEIDLDENIREFVGELIREYDETHLYSRDYADIENDDRKCECDFEKKDNLETWLKSPIEYFLQENYSLLNKTPKVICKLIDIMKTCRKNHITSIFNNLNLNKVNFIDCDIRNSSFKNSLLYDSNFMYPGHCGYIYSCLITNDNKYILSAGRDKTIRKWSIENGEQIDTPFLNHNDGVACLAITNNNKIVISGSADCTIRLWDFNSHDQIGDPLIGHTSVVSCLCVTKDDEYVFSSSYDGTIRKWSIYSSKREGDLMLTHNGIINKIALSSNNRYLIGGCEDGCVFVCDYKYNKKSIIKNKTAVRSLCISTDDKYAYYGDTNGNIKCFEIESNIKKVYLFGKTGSAIETINITSNGQFLFSGERDGIIKLWKRNNIFVGALIQSIFGHNDWINYIDISIDNNIIVSAGGDQTIKIWKFSNQLYEYRKLRGNNDWIRKVITTKNDKIIFAGDDGKIRVWDAIKRRQTISPLIGHTARINALAVSYDEKHIISGGDDGTIRIWTQDNNQKYSSIAIKQDAWIRSIAISSRGDFFVTGSWDNNIKVWDLNNKKQIIINNMTHDASVEGLAITLNGKYLVSCSDDKTIKLWDLNTQTQIGKTMPAHNGFIRSIVLSNDEKYIVSGSYDNEIKIWSIKENCQKGNALIGHRNRVNGLVSKKENIIISCSDDGTIRFWNLNSQKELKSDTIETDSIISDIDILENNNVLVGVGDNSQIHLWRKDSEKVIHNIYKILNCNVTDIDIQLLDESSSLSKETLDALYRNGANIAI